MSCACPAVRAEFSHAACPLEAQAAQHSSGTCRTAATCPEGRVQTAGNAYGLGRLREKELVEACGVLGVRGGVRGGVWGRRGGRRQGLDVCFKTLAVGACCLVMATRAGWHIQLHVRTPSIVAQVNPGDVTVVDDPVLQVRPTTCPARGQPQACHPPNTHTPLFHPPLIPSPDLRLAHYTPTCSQDGMREQWPGQAVAAHVQRAVQAFRATQVRPSEFAFF